MRVNAYLTVSGILFGLVAMVHILRLVTGWPAMLGTWFVPFEFSLSSAIITGALSVWAIVLLRRRT